MKLILVLATIAALAIGGYFWWQLRPINHNALRPLPAAPTSPPLVAPLATTPTTPAQTVAPIDSATAAPVFSQRQPSVPLMAPEKRRPESAAVFTPSRAAPTRTRASAPRPEARPQFSAAPMRKPALEQAYEALQDNRLDEAQHGYLQVLRGDRHNPDALLGLATVAVRQDKLAEAQSLYRRVLEIDPNDATAQAALVNLKGAGDPGLAESKLKSALAGQPDSAALHFALGNLYAGQQRWSEAQQAYFSAFTNASDNPDYIFNLAVSLDHLHQKKLAAQYYQLAAHAAPSTGRVSFDPQLAKKRALELQP